jgi:hypothetical protein
MNWSPLCGEQGKGVVERAKIDEIGQRKTLRSAWEVLGMGVDPAGPEGSEAGLVVGYVQSGKTLSFTTSIGLARDNRFPLVIVIAGTKTNLLAQSADRLSQDLDVDSDNGEAWRLITNPTADDLQTIKKTIEDWSDDELEDDERSTLLIAVLKQQDHLGRLATALGNLDLTDVPVLVIDDEADQAGLNTKVRSGQESTIYRCLAQLRSVLPRHTYLLYTATPQAPLLININSALSPSFVKVLEPGEGYVGGAEFFAQNTPYIRTIPPGEVLDDQNLPSDPPASLIEALRFFFVGLAATLAANGAGAKRRRSMMVHPSRIRDVHRTLQHWVEDTIAAWLQIVELDPSDPDREQLVSDFRASWEDARTTMPSIASFDAVMTKMRRALRRTQVIEFNTNGRVRTPEIKWRNADGWILIGGQALDRGFTVDSLTVTYMPRGIGTGNADAVQQRARFFGYKRSYLGLCRVYLEAATFAAFRNYVQHEEIMRAELEKVAASGMSLNEWTRQFVLSPALRPCRNSVISVGEEYVRSRGDGGWSEQREAKLTPDLRAENARAFDRLLEGLDLDWEQSYVSDSNAQRHEVARDVPLRRVAEFLADYNLPDPRDTAMITGLYVTIGAILEANPDARANVYRMRPLATSTRTINSDGFLVRGFMQGRTGSGREAYPGDRFFHSADRVSVQLHRYNLDEANGDDTVTVATAAPLLSVYVPASLALPTVVQTPAPVAP